MQQFFDRTKRKLLLAKQFIKNLNWASGIGSDGRPTKLPNQEPTEASLCEKLRARTGRFQECNGDSKKPSVSQHARWPVRTGSTTAFHRSLAAPVHPAARNDFAKLWMAAASLS